MSLSEYQKKRNFHKTSEPSGREKKQSKKEQSIFVIQKHDASHLHFDLRLEVDGVLKSWAVPKGPSLDPEQKRLAMMVEDHPYSYRDFEGTIPEGSYGAGEVIVWDTGTYTVENTIKKDREAYIRTGIQLGKIAFDLHGEKLRGSFALVKMHGREENAWLLIKHTDEFVQEEDDFSHESVLSEKVLSRDVSEEHEKKTSHQAKLPAFFTPMLTTLVDEPFTRDGWVYEYKLDGYRTLAFIADGKVDLYSRNHISFNKKFAPIVQALKDLPVSAVIDGEVVGKNEKGKIDFQALQNWQDYPERLYYHVFDLTFLQGQNISHLSLTDRKKLLKELVADISHVQYVEHATDGIKLFEKSQKLGYEGIIAKKSMSTYQSGVRGESWLKIKVIHQQEAVICGYTSPSGSRKHFGSLLLGIYDDGFLRYVGNTGTGFDQKKLAVVKKKLTPLETKHSPFEGSDQILENHVTWVKPKIVCEVNFAGWTQDGLLRQAVFQRIRDDKDSKDVAKEEIKDTSALLPKKTQRTPSSEKIGLTHPEKIYWTKLGLTKKDMFEYYEKVSEVMLPHLLYRPESLHRFPNGIEEPGFFQKDITFDVPDFVELISIESEDVGETKYLVCNNKETLLYMANLGCIEINPWNTRTESLDCPDFFVIDLDPLDVSFSVVVDVAKEVKKVLDKGKITAFCKTSGKKGIHISIPLHGQYETEIVTQFAKLIASLTHQRLPEVTSLERSPQLRRGKVYLDFLQNSKAQTVAAPYSLRPTPEATVSAPIKWSELKSTLDPKMFTLKSMPARIKKHGDLWKDVLTAKNNLKQALVYLAKK